MSDLRGPWRYAFAILAFLGGLPLFAARHLPFSDLPEHVAVIATLRHWWDPAWRSRELFTVDSAFRTQYWLYDLVGAVVAVPLGSAERANVALLFLTAVAMPYALAALLRAARHDERLALLAVPLFWNRALAEGLVNFVASIPVCIFALALALEQAAAPTRRRSQALAALALALFYLHLSSFVLFAAGAVLFAFAFEWRRSASAGRVGGAGRVGAAALMGLVGRVLRASLWAAPVTAAGLLFLATSTVTHPDASQGAHARVIRFFPTMLLVGELPGWMHDIWRSPFDEIAAAIGWLGLALTFLPLGAKLAAADAEAALRLRLARWLLVLAAGLYFLLPTQVGFALILDLRMAPFVGLCAVALARRRQGRGAAAAASLVAASAALSAVSCIAEMRAFEREDAAYIDLMLRRLPFGKRLVTLAFDPVSERTVIPPFLHVGAYYRARYGGIASFSFSELPHWPVRYRPEAAPPRKRIVFWDYAPCLYRNTTDGPAYDFILTRGERRPVEATTPGPKWRVIGAAREWRLYEREEGVTVPVPEGFVDRGPCTETEEAAGIAVP